MYCVCKIVNGRLMAEINWINIYDNQMLKETLAMRLTKRTLMLTRGLNNSADNNNWCPLSHATRCWCTDFQITTLWYSTDHR